MNKLMSGAITQHTSVGVYNDLFNELLALTTEDSTNGTVLTRYMNRLKTTMHVAVVPLIKAQPNITFEEHQALMVDVTFHPLLVFLFFVSPFGKPCILSLPFALIPLLLPG